MASSLTHSSHLRNKASEPLLCHREKKDHSSSIRRQASPEPTGASRSTTSGSSISSSSSSTIRQQKPQRMNEDNLDESVDSMEAKARRNRRTKKKLEQLMLSSGKPPLGDIRRFSQENYVCSFCHVEEPTFQHLLKHISVVHPWYDLTIHQNIR